MRARRRTRIRVQHHGTRTSLAAGFGSKSAACKSGACNMDVACLAAADPWNRPRRSVGAITRNGACGATGTSLRDQYGALFHAFDGNGTSATRMRDYLDPLSTGALFIDGIDAGPSELLFSNGFE